MSEMTVLGFAIDLALQAGASGGDLTAEDVSRIAEDARRLAAVKPELLVLYEDEPCWSRADLGAKGADWDAFVLPCTRGWS